MCCHFLPCAMARYTAKQSFFAVCLSTWHTAKGLCLPCAKPLRHKANTLFHGVFANALYFAVGPILHTAKCLPCARDVAHDKLALCRPLFTVSCLPCVTLGKHFAECKPVFAVCPWHTTNSHIPVVMWWYNSRTSQWSYTPIVRVAVDVVAPFCPCNGRP